MGTSHLQA
jgi:hypothetical protein